MSTIASIIRAHGVRNEEPEILEALETVEPVEFRFPVGGEPADVIGLIFSGCSC